MHFARIRCLSNSLTALLLLGGLTACQTLPSTPAARSAASQATPSTGGATDSTAGSAPIATAVDLAAPIPSELLQAPDLWGRLRRGFAVPVLEHDLVQQHARRFASTAFFDKRADRIRLYLPYIVQEVEQRQLPLELALLPLVESALNPHAQSPVGATGTWQFMAPTARTYELRTSRLVDDRKNLREATRAALDYLQRLNGMFDDWQLAMAAYNWGEGRVKTAVQRARAKGEDASFATLAAQMPAETRNYVPQIMALAALVRRPDLWSASLPAVAEQHDLAEIEVPQDMDLTLALRWAGLTEREFLALNPAVRPPLLLAAATPRLLLPQAAAERWASAQAAHDGPTANWSVLRLSQSQSVGQIAAAHGTTVAELRQLNRIGPGLKPGAGSVLLLPVAPKSGTRTDDGVVASASLNLVPDLVQVYTPVQRDDTLADVARRSQVSVAQLAQWNRLPVNPGRARLRALRGRSLTLWVPSERVADFAIAPVASAASAVPTAVAVAAAPAARSATKVSAVKKVSKPSARGTRVAAAPTQRNRRSKG